MKLEVKISTKFLTDNDLQKHTVSVMFVSAINQVTYLISYLGQYKLV